MNFWIYLSIAVSVPPLTVALWMAYKEVRAMCKNYPNSYILKEFGTVVIDHDGIWHLTIDKAPNKLNLDADPLTGEKFLVNTKTKEKTLLSDDFMRSMAVRDDRWKAS